MSRKISNRAEAPTKVPRASPTCRAPSESSRRRLQWPRGAQNADWLVAGSVAAHCGDSWRKGQRDRDVLWGVCRGGGGGVGCGALWEFVGEGAAVSECVVADSSEAAGSVFALISFCVRRGIRGGCLRRAYRRSPAR